MTTKLNIKHIVASMKAGIKSAPKVAETKKTVIKPSHRERDMRQEAIDIGSHKAKEIFGESNQ